MAASSGKRSIRSMGAAVADWAEAGVAGGAGVVGSGIAVGVGDVAADVTTEGVGANVAAGAGGGTRTHAVTTNRTAKKMGNIRLISDLLCHRTDNRGTMRSQ
jgi:hypothetical protein